MSRKFALIIGNSEYNDKNLACLKTPAADVRALAEVLLDSTRGGFDEAQTLINESDSTIRKAIERFFARKKSDDLLLLYFSGHGVMDDQGRLYLAAQDTEYELWSASAIPASFITDSMDRSQSRRQVLILDCCHSGAFFRGTKSVIGAKAVTETTFEGKGYGKVVLTATDTTQYAWSDDQVIGETETSVFTHFLIEGLKTGAADTNNSGQITLDELYDYVYRNLVSATSKQTPRKWAYNQEGELIIACNPFPVIKPEPLDDELLHALENPSSNVRAGAVRDLEQLLRGRNKDLALTARETLERIAAEDDSRTVLKLVSEILEKNAAVATPAPAREPQIGTVEQKDLKASEAEKEKGQAEKEKEEERRVEGNLIANTRQKTAEEAKRLTPRSTEPPPPSELTTRASPHSLEPEVRPEMFTGFMPADQKRKLGPLAVGAGIVLAIVIGIVAYISSVNNPSRPVSSLPAASPSPIPRTDISKVDFNKLNLRVFDDKYKAVGSSNVIATAREGDLTGDGIDEAAIIVSQMTPSGDDYEVVDQGFVFTMKDGKPLLLDKFHCPTNGAMLKGKPAIETDVEMAGIEIEEGKLIMKCYEAGGSEATARFQDITTFEWNGGKLVQVGRTIRTSID